MNITLRDYQQKIVNNVFESRERGIRRQLVIAFTGSGKTFTLLQIAKRYVENDKKVLILMDMSDLIWQWKENIQKLMPNVSIGVEKAEHRAKMTDQIVLATPQTLGREGNKRITRFDQDHFELFLVDEAHRSITPTWLRVLEYFNAGKDSFDDKNLLVACTATGWRTSGESMGILYDDIIGNYGVDYGLKEGWLVDFQIHNVKTNTDISKVKQYGSKFNQTQLSETVNTPQRNAQILKVYNEVANGEQAIITCASVEHAYDLTELFNENDISAEVIEANTDKSLRKEYIDNHDKGNLDVLLHYNTLSTGLDLPNLPVLIFARPIGSKLLYIQTLGRALRPSKKVKIDKYDSAEERKEAIKKSDKSYSKIIDFHDKAGNHDVAHVPSLFGLHNELQVNKPKKFYSEVVEKLEELHREKGVDPKKVTDLDDIDIIVKRKKFDVDNVQYNPKVEKFTDRRWVEVQDNTYEIVYSDDDKALIIEPDQEKKQLIDVDGWKLVEYDQNDKISKELQQFNSISGAFNIADQYADKKGWNDDFVKQKKWMGKGVSSKQLKLMRKLFSYKNGYSKLKTLEGRYPDTGVRKVKWKPTGKVLSRGDASDIISTYFNNH